MNNDTPKVSILIGALILFALMLLGSLTAEAQTISVLDPCDKATKRVVFDQYRHAREVVSGEAGALWMEVQKTRREFNQCATTFDSGVLAVAQAAYDEQFNPHCEECDIAAVDAAKVRLKRADKSLKRQRRLEFKLARHIYVRCVRANRPRLTIEYR